MKLLKLSRRRTMKRSPCSEYSNKIISWFGQNTQKILSQNHCGFDCSSNIGYSQFDEILIQNIKIQEKNINSNMEAVKNNSESHSKNSEIHSKHKLSWFRQLVPPKSILSLRDSKGKVQSTPGRYKAFQNKKQSKKYIDIYINENLENQLKGMSIKFINLVIERQNLLFEEVKFDNQGYIEFENINKNEFTNDHER